MVCALGSNGISNAGAVCSLRWRHRCHKPPGRQPTTKGCRTACYAVTPQRLPRAGEGKRARARHLQQRNQRISHDFSKVAGLNVTEGVWVGWLRTGPKPTGLRGFTSSLHMSQPSYFMPHLDPVFDSFVWHQTWRHLKTWGLSADNGPGDLKLPPRLPSKIEGIPERLGVIFPSANGALKELEHKA